jgi:hypothetical protein
MVKSSLTYAGLKSRGFPLLLVTLLIVEMEKKLKNDLSKTAIFREIQTTVHSRQKPYFLCLACLAN